MRNQQHLEKGTQFTKYLELTIEVKFTLMLEKQNIQINLIALKRAKLLRIFFLILKFKKNKYI